MDSIPGELGLQRGTKRLASSARALDKVQMGLKLADSVLKLGENCGVPLLPAVCSAARGVLEVVQASRTVINDVLSAAQRTTDILELLQRMTENVHRIDVESRTNVEARMRELQRLLDDVRSAVAAFGKKGWLRHALTKHSKLSQLDSEITAQLDLLLKFYNLARDAHIIDRLQLRKYAVEAEVQRQVTERKALGEAVDEEALEADPEVVRGIAVASGVSDAEFRSELRELGAEVREAFKKHGLKLDKVLEQNQKILEQLSVGSVAAQPDRMSLYAYDRKPDAPPGQKDKPAARLGKGSFGTTHRMRKLDGIDERRYAVKMIESEELDGAGLEKEAHTLSRLEHENVLRFYEAFWHDTDDNRHFVIVTELLTGGSLAEKIVATPPPPPLEVAALMRQAASGLAYVHSLNVQHRDLKPANVLLDSMGRVKIIDFGLACVASASRARSRTKVGTDAYMSPEKADGKRYGPADDVWAAGCILAELLLGRPIGNVARDPTKLKRAIAESNSASGQLGSWVEGCLQESPRRRPGAAVLEHGLASGGPGAQEAEERRLREAAAAVAAVAAEEERVRREAADRSRREAEERSRREAAAAAAAAAAEEEQSGSPRHPTARRHRRHPTLHRFAPSRLSREAEERRLREADRSNLRDEEGIEIRDVGLEIAKIRDVGIEIANDAVRDDNAGNYEDAINKYCKAAEYLMTATKYEKNPVTLKTIREKSLEYVQRAERLKQGLAGMGGEGKKAGGGGSKEEEEEQLAKAELLLLGCLAEKEEEQLAKAEMIRDVVALARDGTDEQKEEAAGALGNLADNADDEVAIAEAGGIAPLVALARDGTDWHKRLAARALANLADNANNQVAIARAGGIAPLVAQAHNGTDRQKAEAVEALALLAWNDDNHVAIASAGGIAPLVALARGGGTGEQREYAAAALRSLGCTKSKFGWKIPKSLR